MGHEYGASEELAFDLRPSLALRNTSALKKKVTEVFELLREPVYRYLFRVLDSPGDAEDLTQEVFLRLYSHLNDGGSVGNVRAWIFRVAHNLAIDQQRKKSTLEILEASGCDRALDSAPCPEERVLEDERDQRLRRAVAQLTTQEKHCLELRAEGLSYREIAEVLEMRPPTLVKYLGRIIKKLAKETNHV